MLLEFLLEDVDEGGEVFFFDVAAAGHVVSSAVAFDVAECFFQEGEDFGGVASHADSVVVVFFSCDDDEFGFDAVEDFVGEDAGE